MIEPFNGRGVEGIGYFRIHRAGEGSKRRPGEADRTVNIVRTQKCPNITYVKYNVKY